MSRNVLKISSSRRLLRRILEEPHLVSIVQNLDPGILNQLIQHVGLEDSAEIISLATTDQLKKIFDEDLWWSRVPGEEEKLNPDRFALWLEVMLELGSNFVGQKLTELDENLVIAGLLPHVLVLNLDELISQNWDPSKEPSFDDLTEKALESTLNHEFEEYLVVSRNPESWDTILSILVALHGDHYDFFQRLMTRFHYLSSEIVDESGGLYQVLTAEEELYSDVGHERELRREKEGFVSPADALSFLMLVRKTSVEEILRSITPDPITRAYFRNFEPEASSERPGAVAGKERSVDNAEISKKVDEFVKFLKDSDVLPASSQVLLLQKGAKSDNEEAYGLLKGALSQLGREDSELSSARLKELRYLANILIAGCRYQREKFRPVEAIEASVAVANLGLEHVMGQKRGAQRSVPELPVQVLAAHDMIYLFKVGWAISFREVSLHAAKALQESLLRQLNRKDLSGDRWVREQVETFSRELGRNVRAEKPWESVDGLDILELIFDVPTIDAFRKLLEQYPSMPKAVCEKDGRERTSKPFIYTQAQIDSIRRWLARLEEPAATE